jgi:hypothetical protein
VPLPLKLSPLLMLTMRWAPLMTLTPVLRLLMRAPMLRPMSMSMSASMRARSTRADVRCASHLRVDAEPASAVPSRWGCHAART